MGKWDEWGDQSSDPVNEDLEGAAVVEVDAQNIGGEAPPPAYSSDEIRCMDRAQLIAFGTRLVRRLDELNRERRKLDPECEEFEEQDSKLRIISSMMRNVGASFWKSHDKDGYVAWIDAATAKIPPLARATAKRRHISEQIEVYERTLSFVQSALKE